MHEFAMKIIRAKKKEKQTYFVSKPSSLFKADDLLSHFVANEDHSEDFLRDIVVSFMLAGKDTTSSALTWFFWLLSSHPKVEAKILAEIKSIHARRHSFDDDAFSFEDLREMNYLHASITESMQLYAPVPFNSLHCLADDVLPDGTAVKKGWFVSYASYSMGRMEALWGSNFDEFKPERSLEAETAKLTIMFIATLMELRFLPPQSQSILLFLFSLSILYFFFFIFRRSTPDGVPAYPPGLEPYPLLGHLPQFVKNRRRLLDWFAECIAATPSNSFVLCRPGGVRGLMTANPVHVEHILRGRFELYPKGPRVTSLLHDFLGDGIFNSDGESWRLQRKTASFEFNTKSLRSFVLRVVRDELLARLLPRLNQAAAQGVVLDLQDLLERFAFDNICKVAFNQDPACLSPDTATAAQDPFSSRFASAFNDASDITSGRFRYAVPKFWMVKKLFGVGSERRLKEAITTVHEFAVKTIRAKTKEKQTYSVSKPSSLFKADDLLSRFVANEDHSEDFLRDIVVSFMLAGKDTTSSALTWFFWLLSSHPEVEAKILAEIKSIRARRHSSDDDEFGFEDLREMNYLHASITESMRLYPPVPLNSLHCLDDDVFPDGTAVKKGWFVSYSSYSMGRMEALWGSDFEEFKPERWLEAETGSFRPESPFKYPVFHGGPRMCLGKEMAYIQMKSIAACVLERFVVTVAREKEAPPPEKMATLTLKMKGGLPVHVMGRQNC
ncbi:hypothetical protein ZIOFF_034128 [Zingiber officinale]|uniref:Cytochrome P450 n=2 Tax=Zingiber officinale TaxID=94328 RepID=A0A8J5LD33_ZINOF|nr:hypothetical protein ZIOFF_034128 [Zingiber officinale]